MKQFHKYICRTEKIKENAMGGRKIEKENDSIVFVDGIIGGMYPTGHGIYRKLLEAAQIDGRI